MNFNQIPNGIKVPGFYAEIDNSRAAGSAVMPWKVLVIGQQTKSAAVECSLVTSDDDADVKYGYGSQLALMIRALRKNAPSVETYALPLNDASSSVAAVNTVTVAGTAGESGTIVLVIDGVRVKVGVVNGETAASIASKIAEEIGTAAAADSATQLPVYASASAGAVTITAKNKGTCGNEIVVGVGQTVADIIPAGLTVTVAAGTRGATDPNLTKIKKNGSADVSVVSVIAGRWFNVIACGLNDDDNIKILKEELDERWTALRQEIGVLFYGKSFDSVAAAQTYYNDKNSQVIVPVCLYKAPCTAWERAARIAGIAAYSAKQDPAMPIGNLEVKGEVAPDESDDLTFEEKQILLDAGCSDIDADKNSRTVYVRRLVTTYKRNSAGAADMSYMQPEVVFCLSYFRWAWNNRMASKYPRTKSAKDDAQFGIGQVVLRPSTVKGEAIDFYKEMCDAGICQGYEYFVENVECEIDPNDPYRINVLLPPEFMKQMFVMATLIQFS